MPADRETRVYKTDNFESWRRRSNELSFFIGDTFDLYGFYDNRVYDYTATPGQKLVYGLDINNKTLRVEYNPDATVDDIPNSEIYQKGVAKIQVGGSDVEQGIAGGEWFIPNIVGSIALLNTPDVTDFVEGAVAYQGTSLGSATWQGVVHSVENDTLFVKTNVGLFSASIQIKVDGGSTPIAGTNHDALVVNDPEFASYVEFVNSFSGGEVIRVSAQSIVESLNQAGPLIENAIPSDAAGIGALKGSSTVSGSVLNADEGAELFFTVDNFVQNSEPGNVAGGTSRVGIVNSQTDRPVVVSISGSPDPTTLENGRDAVININLKEVSGSPNSYDLRQNASGKGVAVRSLFVGAHTDTASFADNEIRAKGDITAFFASDERLKENIQLITDPIGKIKQISGVTFDWKDEVIQNRGGEDGYFVVKNDIGVIAQQIQKVLPQATRERENGFYAVQYDRIIPLLIECIKDLTDRLEKLESR